MAACAVLAIGVYAATSWTSSTPVPQRIHTTSRGERISVQLADGSTVILGAQSKLQYGFPFGDNDRSVYLEGEAYFKVAHQTSKPFVVYTAHSATQVLGTEFLIKAYPNDAEAKVVVTDGKVAFRPRESAEGSGTTLVRGDLAQMNTDGLMTVTRNVAVDTYAGWTRGRLSFQQVTLGSMIQDLERWYDITIELSDPALAKSALSISFDTESVDQAMNMLADVLSLSWTRSGNVITLSPAKRRP
jgi:ferric-dicitrate binding protein FerR (iron transport regulator)